MAEEKAAAPVVDEGAKAEAAYRTALASLVNGDGDTLDGEKKPEEKPADAPKEGEEPEKKEPESEEPKEEGEPEAEEPEGEAGEEEGEKAPEKEEKYSQAFRKLQQREQEVQAFKQQVLQRDRELSAREERQLKAERELAQFVQDLQTDTAETLFRYNLIDSEKADYMARQLYLHSAAAAADPKARAEADRLKQHEKLREGQRQVERRLRALQEEREAEKRKAASDWELNQYTARFEATVDQSKVKHPLLAKALEKYPDDTREELYRIAAQIGQAKDEYPDPTLVVLAWEKRRKAILAAHDAALPVAADKQAKSKPAVEKKGSPNGKTPSSKAPVTDEEKEAAYQKELRARLNGTHVE